MPWYAWLLSGSLEIQRLRLRLQPSREWSDQGVNRQKVLRFEEAVIILTYIDVKNVDPKNKNVKKRVFSEKNKKD